MGHAPARYPCQCVKAGPCRTERGARPRRWRPCRAGSPVRAVAAQAAADQCARRLLRHGSSLLRTDSGRLQINTLALHDFATDNPGPPPSDLARRAGWTDWLNVAVRFKMFIKRRVGLTLGHGQSLMHGVAPQMCGRVASPLLGRGAGGRSPGFLIIE